MKLRIDRPLAIVAGILVLVACSVGFGLRPADTAKAEARDVVRKWDLPYGGACSAVAVAPGTYLTAAHCVPAKEVAAEVGQGRIDGLLVASSHVITGRDLAIVEVPGAACPCATFGENEPVMDGTLLVVGYPGGLYKMISIGQYQGRVKDDGDPYGLAAVAITHGNSGGGVFVVENGQLQLVGITSAGLPGIAMIFVEVYGKHKPDALS